MHDRVPELYWSPELGVVEFDGNVWWRYEHFRVSLRHDGLPNERPKDAERLDRVGE